jgi:DNA repair photolyase
VKSIITRNDSPDVGFDRSINPYRGCEHGCPFCYARPSHATSASHRHRFRNAPFREDKRSRETSRGIGETGYRVEPIAIGVNTDAYQPIERDYKITRSILEVLEETKHPAHLITKSALIERDIDLLSSMAKQNLGSVTIPW